MLICDDTHLSIILLLIELSTLALCGAFFKVTFRRSSTVILGLFNNGVEHFLVGVTLLLLILLLLGVVGVTGDWKKAEGRDTGGKGRGGGGGGGGGGGSDGDCSEGGGGSGGNCISDTDSVACFDESTNEGGGEEGGNGTGGRKDDEKHEVLEETRRVNFSCISSSVSCNFFISCISIILFSFIFLLTSRTLFTSAVTVPRTASILVRTWNVNQESISRRKVVWRQYL